MPQPQFIITVHVEPPRQLSWCLQHLRDGYPSARVVVVADGAHRAEWARVCDWHAAEYRPDAQRLKAVECGGRWWDRFFRIAAGGDGDPVFKWDPDALLRRPFLSFPDADLFGSVHGDGVVQGGVQGFSLATARAGAASRVGLDPLYRRVGSWARSDDTLHYAHSRREVSTDHLLAAIARRLGYRVAQCDEIDSRWWCDGDFRAGVAASHPHKILDALRDLPARAPRP